MKIGLPPDIFNLSFNTQVNKPGQSGAEFLNLLNGSAKSADNANEWFTSHSAGVSSTQELPILTLTELSEETKPSMQALSEIQRPIPKQVVDADRLSRESLSNIEANVKTDETKTTPKMSVAEAGCSTQETVIAPHIQLAFATNKLSYKHSPSGVNFSEKVMLVQSTDNEIERPQQSFTSPKSRQGSASIEVEHAAIYVKASMDQIEKESKQTETQPIKVQHLLSELSPYLKKNVLIVKNEDQFVIYVRDYQSGDAQLENDLQQLRTNLSLLAGKPVQIVINGKSQKSSDIDTMRGAHHAS